MSDIIGMMLQVNPLKRSSTDELLKNEIILRRSKGKIINEKLEIKPKAQPMTLLGTIKLPKNMNEINQRLPKKKMYKQEK
jgi:hypothetical protein